MGSTLRGVRGRKSRASGGRRLRPVCACSTGAAAGGPGIFGGPGERQIRRDAGTSERWIASAARTPEAAALTAR